jgi:hypothetical protein
MNILAAKSLLLKTRMDWHKPHLAWLPSRVYRLPRLRG